MIAPQPILPLADELPDADIVVLVALDANVPGLSAPTWFGFLDGDVWRDVSTGDEFAGPVTHWADLPEGPRA